MQQVQTLIKNYQESYKKWDELLEEERQKREELIENTATPSEEPEDLREQLDSYCEKSGLRERQSAALQTLKDAEAALFEYQLENCAPAMQDDLRHLARDYAGRITWLKQFLPQDIINKNDSKKK